MSENKITNYRSELRGEPQISGKGILLIIGLGIAFYVMYELTVSMYFYFRFGDYDFISAEYTFGTLLVLFFMVTSVAFTKQYLKNKEKRFLAFNAVINVIVIVLAFCLNCNVWVFKDKTISYNTLYTENEVVYEYDDIEKATISTEDYRANRFRATYILQMYDGYIVDLKSLYMYYSSDSKSIIEFDKSIAHKREILGEYSERAFPVELSEYFAEVYEYTEDE